MTIGLSTISNGDLEALAAALERGTLRAPFTETALQARGLGHLCDVLTPYLHLDASGLRAVVDVVLAERRNRRAPKLDLVWSGDDPGTSLTRYTRIVLSELFARARKSVLIAGYSFDQAEMFAPLHRVMVEHSVTCTMFVDVDQMFERLRSTARAQGKDWAMLSAPLKPLRDPVQRGRAVVALFLRLLWPFGEPRPAVYFDPRTAAQWSEVSLHAKCVVIDHELTLITSANFTNRGQTRNLEAGVAIEDRDFATSLERQWHNLMNAGVLERA